MVTTEANIIITRLLTRAMHVSSRL